MATALALPNVAGYSFDVAPDLSKPEVRRRLTPGGLRTFTSSLPGTLDAVSA